ncbi:MAG: hypothetical protein ACYCVZ_06620 [Streptosporangiaceae bacterium]
MPLASQMRVKDRTRFRGSTGRPVRVVKTRPVSLQQSPRLARSASWASRRLARASRASQLAAQEAKAWARIGDRRQTEVALDRGRRLLEAMPYPENLDHHFVVDPAKFDFYAMDCYRLLGEDKMAGTLAGEVLHASTDLDGTERSPMRAAEARLTLAVVAARQGDVEQAVTYGQHALSGPRRSLPSLIMASRDLTMILRDQHRDQPVTRPYFDQLRELAPAADLRGYR